MPLITSKEKIRKILQSSKSIAVVGISPEPSKPSYLVSEVVKRYGFKLFFVNPKYEGTVILGERVYRTLLNIQEEIHIVNIFRRPGDVVFIAEEAVKKGFKTFWFQPQTLNKDISRRLSENGYNVVKDYCLKTACIELL